MPTSNIDQCVTINSESVSNADGTALILSECVKGEDNGNTNNQDYVFEALSDNFGVKV